MYIEMGLKPTYDCSSINLGKLTKFDLVFHTDKGELEKEKRGGTMLEYVVKKGRWDCARLWLKACSDQLPLELLCVVKKQVDLMDPHATHVEDFHDFYSNLKSLVEAGSANASPVWVFDQGEGASFIEQSLNDSYNRRLTRKSQSTTQIIRRKLNIALNESIVGNYGARSAQQSLVCLVLGATPWSTGLSWHQGCFDDIFPLLEEKGAEYHRVRQCLGAESCETSDENDKPSDIQCDPKYLEEDLATDPNSWIAAYYHQYKLARLMVEMGAPIGVAPNYDCDFVVFTELCIEDWTAKVKSCQGSELFVGDGSDDDGDENANDVLNEVIHEMEQFRYWLLQYEKQGPQA